jgi:hypothetical protein
MRSIDRKASWFAVPALLACGGIGMGALASSLTSDARVWRPPSHIPVTDEPVAAPVDQASAGQAWARSAYDGGLRQCPQMNDAFLAACQEEMRKLAERPAFPAGSYGGPLLITKYEPARDDGGWDAQDRLETPRAVRRQTDYSPPEAPAPQEATFEPTPDNYPAAPDDAPRPE